MLVAACYVARASGFGYVMGPHGRQRHHPVSSPKEFVLTSFVGEPPKNLFRAYMQKGLYQCTSEYIDTVSQLHALIKVEI